MLTRSTQYSIKPRKLLPKTMMDDRLILLRNLNGEQLDKKRKPIIKIFKDIVLILDIGVQTDLKEEDFYDVTLKLQNGTYHPY